MKLDVWGGEEKLAGKGQAERARKRRMRIS